MEKLKSLWRGELALGDAFWNWAVLGALAVNLATSVAFLGLVALDRPWLALIVGYVFSIPYNIVALVGVWRAAARHAGAPLNADLARGFSLVLLTVLSVT